jgi:hypothetical protein
MSTTKTFMDWEPNQDWTVFKPKVTTESTAFDFDFDIDSTINNSWTQPKSSIEQNAARIFSKNTDTSGSGFDFGNMFSGKNIGGTLQGIGSISGALASIYGISEQKKFNEDMLDMEKQRVAKEYEKRDNKQAEYDAVWKG